MGGMRTNRKVEESQGTNGASKAGRAPWRIWRQLLAGATLLLLLLTAASAYSAPKNLLVLGDSLSAEYGLQRGSGWSQLLQARLRQHKLEATVFNASISGDTTIGGKNRLQALLEQHKPDVVLIELGSNDALRGLPLNATRDNLQAMIDMAAKARARVLLIGMQVPPNYGPDYTRRFAAVFDDLSKKNKLPLVPFFMEGIATDMNLYQADRLHPNEQAQPRLLNNVWPHLKPLLGLK